MSKLKKFDLDGKNTGERSVGEKFLSAKASPQSIKNYLDAIRKNARQWSANTKTRAEVACTGKKPHAQKGTGRARQGSAAAPHYKGGGVAFGPKPKFNQRVQVNKKERQAVIRALLANKIKDDQVKILEDSSINEPKTKKIANLIEKMGIKGKRILFIDHIDEKTNDLEKRNYRFFQKSMKNIPKTHFTITSSLNGYEIAVCQELVLTNLAFDWIKEHFIKEKVVK